MAAAHSASLSEEALAGEYARMFFLSQPLVSSGFSRQTGTSNFAASLDSRPEIDIGRIAHHVLCKIGEEIAARAQDGRLPKNYEMRQFSGERRITGEMLLFILIVTKGQPWPKRTVLVGALKKALKPWNRWHRYLSSRARFLLRKEGRVNLQELSSRLAPRRYAPWAAAPVVDLFPELQDSCASAADPVSSEAK
jgi:hypothetical protein